MFRFRIVSLVGLLLGVVALSGQLSASEDMVYYRLPPDAVKISPPPMPAGQHLLLAFEKHEPPVKAFLISVPLRPGRTADAIAEEFVKETGSAEAQVNRIAVNGHHLTEVHGGNGGMTFYAAYWQGRSQEVILRCVQPSSAGDFDPEFFRSLVGRIGLPTPAGERNHIGAWLAGLVVVLFLLYLTGRQYVLRHRQQQAAAGT